MNKSKLIITVDSTDLQAINFLFTLQRLSARFNLKSYINMQNNNKETHLTMYMDSNLRDLNYDRQNFLEGVFNLCTENLNINYVITFHSVK